MRKEKTLLLEEIKDKIRQRPSFVLVEYKGLAANVATAFRNDLRQKSADYEVVRKKVFLKAASDLNVDITLGKFAGHLGVVFAAEDAVDAAKTVFTFAKANDNVVSVVGACIDGKAYGQKDVELLSKLPGKDEMRAQLLGLFEAPMSQTLAVMEALVASVLYCLDNKAKKDSEN